MRIQLTLLISSLLFASTAFAQEKWTLQRAVQHALDNNISVKQADIQARLSALNYETSKLSRIPTLGISVGGGINSGRSINPTTNLYETDQLFYSSFNLQTGVTLFNFFSIKNNIEGNKLESEAARKNFEMVQNDVSLNVATAYLLVLNAMAQERAVRLSVELTKENLENTRKRVAAGDLPELNVAELETQLATDSTNLINAQAAVFSNLLQLKAILNLDPSTPFEIAEPSVEDIPVLSLAELEPEYVFSVAVNRMPQQMADSLRIEAARRFVKSARGQMLPSLSVSGGLGSQYSSIQQYLASPPIFTGNYIPSGAKVNVNNVEYEVLTPEYIQGPLTPFRNSFGKQFGDNFRQSLGLTLSIPIFNQGQIKAGVRRAEMNVESLELTRQQDLLTLKQNIYTAYNDARSAIQRLNSSRKGVETAEKAYYYAQKRYERGLLSTIDLITNQNNLNRARIEYITAQMDYVFRLKLLEFYKGEGITL